jgi:menaquinol-cytochrome c reductase iron-sulfur subunit
MGAVSDRDFLSRRGFIIRVLGAVAGFMGALLGIPLLLFLFGPTLRGRYAWRWLGRAVPPTLRSRDPWVRVGPIEEIPRGAAALRTVRVPVQDGWIREDALVAVYVSRISSDQIAVFDIHCTHMGCPVRWNAASKRFLCPCHGGVFDASGDVLTGPPPRPLDRYAVKTERGVLYMGPLAGGDG